MISFISTARTATETVLERLGEYVLDHPFEPAVQSALGRHLEDPAPLLISRHAGFPGLDDRARFDALCHKLRRVSLPHGPVVVAMESPGPDLLYTVTPLPPGRRLDTLRLPLALEDALCIGEQLAGTLGHMHELGVLHLDVRPEQVYWEEEGRTATLVRPRLVALERAQTQGVEMWSRRARYGAPEVTQPLPWSAQRASDAYGLGVLVWEMCTGAALFPAARTPHQWIQAHLSHPWVPPPGARGLPDQLLRVLGILLQKHPADRDLDLLEVARGFGAIARGGQQEWAWGPLWPRRDYLSQTLVGRGAVCSQLEKRLRNSRRYPVHFALLHGAAGMGKTSLLRWYETRVRQEEDCVLVACDPGLACGVHWERELLGALEGAVVSMGSGRRERWVEEMHTGPALVVQGLSARSSFFDQLFQKRRQRRAFFSSAETLAKPPLEFLLLQAYGALGRLGSEKIVVVLTLDDMEQLEPQQLDRLERWVWLLEERGLVVRVVATIDRRALEPERPQGMWIGQLGQRAKVDMIPVDGLEEDAVILWVCEALQAHRHLLDDRFLGLLTAVSGGSPLRVSEAIAWWRASFEQGGQTSADQMTLFWEGFVDGDISRLLAARCQHLDAEMIDTLRACAAYRRSLSLLTLAALLERPLEHLWAQLQQVVELGVLCWRRDELCFVHQEVREAMGAGGGGMVFELARLMLERVPSLDVAGPRHVLQCADLLLGVDASAEHEVRDLDRGQVMACLSLAAQAALMQDECQEVMRYGALALALEPGGEAQWCELTGLVAEALVRAKQPEQALAWIDRALDRVSEVSCRHGLHVRKLSILSLLSQDELVLDVVQQALGELSEAPLDVGESTAFASLFTPVEARLSTLSSLGALATLPPLPPAHPKALAQSFLARLLPLTAAHLPGVFASAACRIMALVLDHGVCADSARGITACAQLLASEWGRHEEAMALGQVAAGMAQQDAFASGRAGVYLDLANRINPWGRRIQDSQVLNERAHAEALRAGDMPHAGLALMHDAHNRFSQGMPLPRLNAILTRARHFCRQTQHRLACDVLDGLALVLRDDLGLDPEPGAPPLHHDHHSFMRRGLGARHDMARALYAVAKMRTQAMAQHSEGALESAALFLQLRPHIRGLHQEREGAFLYALLLHTRRRLEGRLHDPPPPELAALTRDLNLQASANPAGAHHRLLWLEAVCTKDLWTALGKYESAYHLARTQQLWHDAAMIKAQCARLLHQEGKASLCLSYQEEVHDVFMRWGFRPQPLRLSDTLAATPPGSWSLPWLTQLSLSLAAKTDLHALLEAAIPPLLEISAASQAALVCERRGEFVFLVRALAPSRQVEWVHGQDAVLAKENVSLGVLQAVADLDQEIVLHDACHEGPFTHDPRVHALLVRSLCCGLVHRGRGLRVYVYLEQLEVADLFSHARLEQIHVLLEQVSWAIGRLE